MPDLPTASAEDLTVLDAEFVSFCTSHKENAVLRYDERKPHSDDISPLFTLKDEEGEPISIVLVAGGRDEALSGLMGLIPAMTAAEAVLCVDAHYTSQLVNPANGQPWDQRTNRMDKACENGACALGVITDCLAVTGMRRDGLTWQYILPYHVHYEDKTVHWQTPEGPLVERGDNKFHLEGVIADAMRDFFQTKTFDEMMAERGVDPAKELGIDDPRRARLHTYLGVVRMFSTDDRFLISLCARDDEEIEIIRESNEHWLREAEALKFVMAADAAAAAERKRKARQ